MGFGKGQEIFGEVGWGEQQGERNLLPFIIRCLGKIKSLAWLAFAMQNSRFALLKRRFTYSFFNIYLLAAL